MTAALPWPPKGPPSETEIQEMEDAFARLPKGTPWALADHYKVAVGEGMDQKVVAVCSTGEWAAPATRLFTRLLGHFPELMKAARRHPRPITPTKAVVDYIDRYGGMCRDCADNFGICERSGLPCRDSDKAIRFVLNALNYGIQKGYLGPSPHTAVGAPLEADEKMTIYGVIRRRENGATAYLGCSQPRWFGPRPPSWTDSLALAQRFDRLHFNPGYGGRGEPIFLMDEWSRASAGMALSYGNRRYYALDWFQKDGDAEAKRLGGPFADFLILRETVATTLEALPRPLPAAPVGGSALERPTPPPVQVTMDGVRFPVGDAVRDKP